MLLQHGPQAPLLRNHAVKSPFRKATRNGIADVGSDREGAVG